jgi:hypothetical protein
VPEEDDRLPQGLRPGEEGLVRAPLPRRPAHLRIGKEREDAFALNAFDRHLLGLDLGAGVLDAELSELLARRQDSDG